VHDLALEPPRTGGPRQPRSIRNRHAAWTARPDVRREGKTRAPLSVASVPRRSAAEPAQPLPQQLAPWRGKSLSATPSTTLRRRHEAGPHGIGERSPATTRCPHNRGGHQALPATRTRLRGEASACVIGPQTLAADDQRASALPLGPLLQWREEQERGWRLRSLSPSRARVDAGCRAQRKRPHGQSTPPALGRKSAPKLLATRPRCAP
jgi:hypothetical protein